MERGDGLGWQIQVVLLVMPENKPRQEEGRSKAHVRQSELRFASRAILGV